MSKFTNFEGTRRRREINLGGASTSNVNVVEQARATRLARDHDRRRQQAALSLQAWWRGRKEAWIARRYLGEIFDRDPSTLDALRALILIGRDDDRLATWSNLAADAERGLFVRADWTHHRWLLLQLSRMLLTAISQYPESNSSLDHLKVLNIILSASRMAELLPTEGREICQTNTQQLVVDGILYHSLSLAIQHIPEQRKKSPSLPFLVNACIQPLITLKDAHLDIQQTLASSFVTKLLAIPLLPNRLPLSSLTAFSAGIPFGSLPAMQSNIRTLIDGFSQITRIHMLCNLAAFVPPRYAKLSTQAFDAVLITIATLFNSLDSTLLDPKTSNVKADDLSDESDVEMEDIGPTPAATTTSATVVQLDPRAKKRLESLFAESHISAVLTYSGRHPSTRETLFAFLVSTCAAWPSKSRQVLSALVIFSGGGLVRELYRGWIRSSPVGKAEDLSASLYPELTSAWSALLVLVDVYTEALLTMGDDEFFGGGTNARAARNPLTLEEVKSFSRQLLNITFALYWREDQAAIKNSGLTELNVSWMTVRDKLTKCLVAIQARDSRRPFTSPDHWIVISQVNVKGFVEAAVAEESAIDVSSHRRHRAGMQRQLASLSPRLGILHNIPFAIPFEVRVAIFRNFVYNDMVRLGRDAFDWHSRPRVSIRRKHIAEDGFDKLGEVDLKGPIQISFIDEFGEREAGIDGGGVFKEFFTSLCKEVFDSNRGLWLSTAQNELYPNPHSYAKEQHSLSWYRFIGRVLGKALYEGILIDVAFAPFFLAKWLGRQSLLDDLVSLDPELYRGLLFLKHYPGNPEELSLNFTITDEEFGVSRTVDLIPNGSNVQVTGQNRLQYIILTAHYRLSKQIKLQSEAFFEGLTEMVDPKWLQIFNQQELQILIGGVNHPLDVEDLRAHTLYGGLYDTAHPTIVAFWRVVQSFDEKERGALLRFVTSCSRPPLLGFKELNPRFSIRDAGEDNQRLPTASTCVNLLKLPRYSNEPALRDRLLKAIHSNAGFDLS